MQKLKPCTIIRKFVCTKKAARTRPGREEGIGSGTNNQMQLAASCRERNDCQGEGGFVPLQRNQCNSLRLPGIEC